MDNFTKSNHQRNLSNADVLSKNAIEFFHFHIEAFDDKIAINKFKDKSTFNQLNPRMVRPGSAVTSLDNTRYQMKKFKDLGSQIQTAGASIGIETPRDDEKENDPRSSSNLQERRPMKELKLNIDLVNKEPKAN